MLSTGASSWIKQEQEASCRSTVKRRERFRDKSPKEKLSEGGFQNPRGPRRHRKAALVTRERAVITQGKDKLLDRANKEPPRRQ